MKLRLLGYYYLFFKGTQRERINFVYKHDSEICSQALVLWLATLIFRLFLPFLVKPLSITLLVTTVIFCLTTILTTIDMYKYRELRWKEILQEREEKRKQEEAIIQVKSRCNARIEYLKQLSGKYNLYYDFYDNISELKRKVKEANNVETLDLLLMEIENNIIMVEQMHQQKEKARQEEQKRWEQWRQQSHRSTPPRPNSALESYLMILGLDPNERNIDVIRKRRKELAIKYHPDNKETGNLQKMQEINNAFDEIEKILK